MWRRAGPGLSGRLIAHYMVTTSKRRESSEKFIVQFKYSVKTKGSGRRGGREGGGGVKKERKERKKEKK
jgi:hypothetical protein